MQTIHTKYECILYRISQLRAVGQFPCLLHVDLGDNTALILTDGTRLQHVVFTLHN